MKISIVACFDRVADSRLAGSVRLLVDSLRASGHDATLLCWSYAGSPPSASHEGWAATLTATWRSHGAPDVVHALGEPGVAATLAAANGSIPVVATFLGDPTISATERTLAGRSDRLLVLSAREAHQWVRLGYPRERVHVFHLPASTASDRAEWPPMNYVVTDARGVALEAIVASMPAWSGARSRPRLIALSALGAGDFSVLARQAKHRRALDDVELRPGLTGAALSELMGGASLAIVAEPRRDGGLALEAARHGVPSIAADDDPLNDVVVNGATGLVVPSPLRPDTIGKAVRYLLHNRIVREGCGAGALRRVRAIRNADTATRQALAAYSAYAESPGSSTPSPTGSDESTGLRPHADVEHLVTSHVALARQLAQRYFGRGQALEDLVGVANLGLVKAAERFDPDHGSSFPSYAVPTILGELRRYFRDHAWAVRVPRTLQEHALDVERVADDLRAELGGDATRQQVADELKISDGIVAEAQQTRREALSSASLDRPIGEDSDGVLGDLLGAEDGRLSSVEEAQAVRDALARLPDRERDIVVMSFYGEHTQAEIADHLGISQVHVSRTLARTLATLRRHVVDEAPLPDSWRLVDSASGAASSRERASA